MAVQRAFGIAGPAGLLIAGIALLIVVERDGVQASQMGDWPAPFGITLVADLLSAIMVVLGGLVGTAAAVYSLATVDKRRARYGYYSLFNLLLMGVSGAFLTGDIFNMFVWFEVMLISSFVLVALGGERPQIEGAVKYVSLNLVASALFLTGAGLIYAMAGSLNIADLSQRIPELESQGLVTAVSMLFLVAFGIKAAAFPLYFWLPASYHTPPSDVSALFSGLLTKVGVYALIRVFSLIFVQDVGITHTIILSIAGLTMLSGVLGAIAQFDFRRILSFHIVSQIGYMLMGLGLFTPLGLAGGIFYLVHHILVKTALFLVSGAVRQLHGTLSLQSLGGLYRSQPLLAILFAASAASLAGIPPLSGFIAKFVLVRAGLAAESYVIVGVALLVSLLTVFSMTKIWTEVFWKPAPPGQDNVVTPVPVSRMKMAYLLLPTATLVLLSVMLGIGAGPALDLAQRAAEQLLNPAEYVEAVLGARP